VNELVVTTRTTSTQHSNRHLFPQLRFLVHGDISVQHSRRSTVFQRVTTDRKHVLHEHNLIPLPSVASQNYTLRQRRHNLELSTKSGLWFWFWNSRQTHWYWDVTPTSSAADYGRRLLKQLREGASAMSLSRLFHSGTARGNLGI